ncbi:MAG: DUF2807 domain-containing protein [Bacteroidota bacterium]
MKHLTICLLSLFSTMLLAQRKPKIKGNRMVTEVREVLPPFNAIELKDNLDVVLKKSFGPGYEVKADDNLVDILKFDVQDSTLIISSFYTVTSKKEFDIAVNFTELRAITIHAGSVDSEAIISSDELFIDVFGDAELNLEASAHSMNLNLEGSSTGDFNLDVDSLNISAKSRVKALVYAVSGSQKIELRGNASLDLEGTTDLLVADLTGSTKLKGQTMEAASIELKLEESTNAHIYAYRDLELTSKGNAKTYLYGNPNISVLEFLDASQLIKKEE